MLQSYEKIFKEQYNFITKFQKIIKRSEFGIFMLII